MSIRDPVVLTGRDLLLPKSRDKSRGKGTEIHIKGAKFLGPDHVADISVLVIRDCEFRAEAFQTLLQTIERSRSLIRITITGCHLTRVEAVEMTKKLKYFSTLERLDLSDNDIDDLGFAAIVQSLRFCPSLSFLSLQGNKLTNKSIQFIAFLQHRNLQLELGGNMMDNGMVIQMRMTNAIEVEPPSPRFSTQFSEEIQTSGGESDRAPNQGIPTLTMTAPTPVDSQMIKPQTAINLTSTAAKPRSILRQPPTDYDDVSENTPLLPRQQRPEQLKPTSLFHEDSRSGNGNTGSGGTSRVSIMPKVNEDVELQNLHTHRMASTHTAPIAFIESSLSELATPATSRAVSPSNTSKERLRRAPSVSSTGSNSSTNIKMSFSKTYRRRDQDAKLSSLPSPFGQEKQGRKISELTRKQSVSFDGFEHRRRGSQARIDSSSLYRKASHHDHRTPSSSRKAQLTVLEVVHPVGDIRPQAPEARPMSRVDLFEYIKTLMYEVHQQALQRQHEVFDELGQRGIDSDSDSDSSSSGSHAYFNVAPLTSRDLRHLDFSLTAAAPPAIVVREHAFLLMVDPLRALVLKDRCIIVFANDTLKSDEREMLVVKCESLALALRRRSERLPFELEAVEFVFGIAFNDINGKLRVLLPKVEKLLVELRKKGITSERIEALRLLKTEVDTLRARAQGVHTAISDVLEEDEDMMFLQLTKLYHHPEIIKADTPDTHESESVLQSSLLHATKTEREINFLKQKIQGTEQLLKLKLDQGNNLLLTVDLTQNTLTLCINIIGAIAALFGMNLGQNASTGNYSFVEEGDTTWFTTITSSSAALAVIIFIGSMLLFYRIGILFW